LLQKRFYLGTATHILPTTPPDFSLSIFEVLSIGELCFTIIFCDAPEKSPSTGSSSGSPYAFYYAFFPNFTPATALSYAVRILLLQLTLPIFS
jgi:hypothetical protein